MRNLPIRRVETPTSKYSIKCPYDMVPEEIATHNTANDAPAMNEISYMLNNNNMTSYHFAVDDVEAVQGLPLNRNGFHAGDGANGRGNRKSIGVEICYSKSGGDKFTKAEQNGATLIAMLLKQYGWGIEKVKKHQDYSGKYCLPLDCTELLTPNGWVSLYDINIGDLVAQYNNGKIEFVNVLDTVEPYQSDVLRVDKTEATLNHRMVTKTNKQEDYEIKTWGDILNSNDYHTIPHSGFINNDGINLTDDELLLMVWVQGDGHYMKRKSRKDDSFYYIGVEFHLSKQRKIDRIKYILEQTGIKFTHIIQTDGTSKIRLFGKQYVEYFETFLKNKEFTWDLLKMNKHQFDLFFEEIQIVDGCKVNTSYCSTVQQNMDVVQALCAINGVRSNQCLCGTSEQVLFGVMNLGFKKNKEATTRNTLVSCVSVPSGAIVIRQYGQPKVVGNCPHRTLDMGWDRFLNMIRAELGEAPVTPPVEPVEPSKPSGGMKYGVGTKFTCTGLWTQANGGTWYPASGLSTGKGDYEVGSKVYYGADHPYQAIKNGTVIGFANDKCIDDEPSVPGGTAKPTPPVVTPPTSSTKYGVGTKCTYTGLWSSSNGGTWYPKSSLAIREGTVTKVIIGVEHPYLINDGVGWANDKCIDDEPSVPGGASTSNPTPSAPKPSSTKYGVGTKVCTNTLATSSTGGKVYKGDWKGTITRVIPGTAYPYLIDNGTGWTNDTGIDTDPHSPY